MFLESLKANFIIFLFFVAILGAGYWAVDSLQISSEKFYPVKENIHPIVQNGPPNQESKTETVANNNQPQPQSPAVNQPITSSNFEFEDLKQKIQKLIDDNVLMKNGSRGTRVGTVQEFLNLYNGTDSRIDNDFGNTTENQVKVFQRAEGLNADGQTGLSTYRKMIEWLSKQ